MNNSITINGTEYRVKNTLRAMFIFEKITNKTFNIETLLDNYIYFYSILLASNNENIIDWDDFIDALDNDPSLYRQLNDILVKNSKIDELLGGEEKNQDGEKKN